MGFASGFSAGADARARRDQINLLKEQRDQELQKQGYDFSSGTMKIRPDSQAEADQLAIKETTQLAKSLQAKLAAQDSDRAFEDFSHTGDANYLQKALDNNPDLKQAWGVRGIHLIGNIDFENDANLLARAGFKPSEYDTPEKQAIIKKNIFKTYDGKNWNISLANKAVAETGTLSRLGNRRGDVLTSNYQQFVDLMAGPKSSANTVEGHKYEKEITAAIEKYPNVPSNLVAAMMNVESANNPHAVSSKGARGLMQLMPKTATELGVADPTNPAQNIEGGVKYISQLLDKYQGDVNKALAAYNAGSGNVDKYNGIPPFGETQNYVSKVLSNFDAGELYYGRTADQTISTILEHHRAIANAKQGTTNKNVDMLAQNEVNKTSVAQQANDIKLKTEGQTSKQKDLNAADDETQNLLDKFGGSDQFYQTDFNNQENYNKAYKNMVKIEELTNTAPSEAEKKQITDLRTLINLGSDVSKLTVSETGVIDKNLGNLKKYFSENVKGTSAKTAWAAYRNIYIHAMAGTAQTPQEAKRNAEALGSLGTQLGPTLAMFNTSLSQVSTQLDSVSRNMNPYSAQIRLGADKKKLDSVRENINNTIRYLNGMAPISSNRKSLDEIFKAK